MRQPTLGGQSTLGQTISTGKAEAQAVGKTEPVTGPAERFAQSVDHLQQTLDMLTTTVDELVGDMPPTGQPEEATGRSTPSILDLVHQYPDAITRLAEQVGKQNERLRDAFLR
jgi:hypothetical protein